METIKLDKRSDFLINMRQSVNAVSPVCHVHMIGIGGIGMSGIAEILLALGYTVSGSDLLESWATKRLADMGAQISIGHHAQALVNVDVAVYSSAIKPDNPEYMTALARRIPLIERAEMLGQLVRFQYGIVVSGAHGKTTTTSMIYAIFSMDNHDPTFVIGGQLLKPSGELIHAHLGQSPYFIIEADESDGSFKYIDPMVAIITNIDQDHMETYNFDVDVMKNAYLDFIHNTPFHGKVILCHDCEILRSMYPSIRRRIVTYGFHPDSDYCVLEESVVEGKQTFVLRKPDGECLLFSINVFGRHNVLNAAAAAATAFEESFDSETVVKGLASFKSVHRRCNLYQMNGFEKSFYLVDDYGHHPAEITYTIQTLRNIYPNQRLCMLFQPHRYSRTQFLFDDFVRVLSAVDRLMLLPVYAASENRIQGADEYALQASIAEKMKNTPLVCSNQDQTIDSLSQLLQNDDVLLIQGAGDISQIADFLLKNAASYKIL